MPEIIIPPHYPIDRRTLFENAVENEPMLHDLNVAQNLMKQHFDTAVEVPSGVRLRKILADHNDVGRAGEKIKVYQTNHCDFLIKRIPGNLFAGFALSKDHSEFVNLTYNIGGGFFYTVQHTWSMAGSKLEQVARMGTTMCVDGTFFETKNHRMVLPCSVDDTTFALDFIHLKGFHRKGKNKRIWNYNDSGLEIRFGSSDATVAMFFMPELDEELPDLVIDLNREQPIEVMDQALLLSIV